MTGTAQCVCDLGYTGAACDTCDTGYQDNDGDGSCEPSCATTALACHHGVCDDASGTPRCECEQGYAGVTCDTCADGYQDNDQNGTCTPDCTTANLACVHGACSDASGTAQCVCDTGYAGAACDTCAAGYQDHDTNGTCTPDCTLAALWCGHGACSDLSGTAQCVCEAGYTGETCDSCAVGYQDNDANGTCTPTCATADLTCNTHYACDDTSGTAQCEPIPPGPVSDLRYGDLGGISLHWTPPAGHWDTVTVVRKTDGYPSSPDDGEVIFEGRARSTVDTTAVPGTTYLYAVWTMFDGVPSTSAARLAVTGYWTTHTYTESADLTVDPSLRYLTVHAWGAGGGGAYTTTNYWVAGPGGGGGYATATIETTPGEQYRVVVGAPGRSGEPGGYNGTENVGRGGYGNCSDVYNGIVAPHRGGSGGQMSGLYAIDGSSIPVDIGRWVVIAGGGGGGSPRSWPTYVVGYGGGAGGGASGANGGGDGGGGGGHGGVGGAAGGHDGGYGTNTAGASWTQGGHGGVSNSYWSSTEAHALCGGAGGGGYGGGGGGAPGYADSGGGGGGGGYARGADGVFNLTLAGSGRNPPQMAHVLYPSWQPGLGGAVNNEGHPGYVVVLQGRCPPGLGGFLCTTDIAAPAPVTSLTAVAADGELTWTASTSSDAVGVVIRRSASGYPATVDDGEFVADLPADVDRYEVPAGETFYYALFTYDAAGNYSEGARVQAW